MLCTTAPGPDLLLGYVGQYSVAVPVQGRLRLVPLVCQGVDTRYRPVSKMSKARLMSSSWRRNEITVSPSALIGTLAMA